MRITGKFNGVKPIPGLFLCINLHDRSTLLRGVQYRLVEHLEGLKPFYLAFDPSGKQAKYTATRIDSKHLFSKCRFKLIEKGTENE